MLNASPFARMFQILQQEIIAYRRLCQFRVRQIRCPILEHFLVCQPFHQQGNVNNVEPYHLPPTFNHFRLLFKQICQSLVFLTGHIDQFFRSQFPFEFEFYPIVRRAVYLNSVVRGCRRITLSYSLPIVPLPEEKNDHPYSNQHVNDIPDCPPQSNLCKRLKQQCQCYEHPHKSLSLRLIVLIGINAKHQRCQKSDKGEISVWHWSQAEQQHSCKI